MAKWKKNLTPKLISSKKKERLRENVYMGECKGLTAQDVGERKSHWTLRCLVSDVWLAIKVNIFSLLTK